MNKKIKVPLPPRARKVKLFLELIPIWFTIAFIFIFIIYLASLNDARKPAIYLYPTEDSTVEVKVDVKGLMYKDIPAYNGGWKVFATKDGLIDGQYDYLFYEALLWRLDLPEEGWVVPYSDLEVWFATMLPALGLNDKESAQFMEYWLTELPVANYYEVKQIEDSYLDKHLALSISPEPDTLIRVLLNFRPLDNELLIPTPTIATPERKGFVVAEWGGFLDN